MDEDTKETRKFLTNAGFSCDPGDSHVPRGRHPDLFCSAPHTLWVEVKRIDPTLYECKIARLGRQIESVLDDLGISSFCVRWISQEADDRHLKMMKKLLIKKYNNEQLLRSKSLLLVQRDAFGGNYVNFTLPTDFGILDVLSSAVLDGAYGVPEGIMLAPDTKSILVTDMHGNTAQLDPRCWPNRNVALGIELTVGGQGLGAHDMSGGWQRDRTVQNVRSAIKGAEDQLKNGLKYRDASCLVVLRAGSMFSYDSRLIGAALYGNMTIGRSSDGRRLTPFRKDAAIQRCRTRWLSGVLVFPSRGGPPVLFHNVWADKPLPATLRGAEAYTVTEGDTIVRLQASEYREPTCN